MRKLGFILAAIALSSSAVSAVPPVLGVSPTYMEFTAYEGGANPEPNILSIWRDGGNGPLWWDVIEDCNWITVDPNSGKSMGEVDDCNVIVDISSLAGGLYNCQLTVDAGTAANSPQIVDVNLTVIGPALQISQTYFEFTAYEGGANPNDQVLTITNTGGGTLKWQITEDCNWLSAEPNSGSSTGEADDANLSVEITGLTGGIYNCQLMVSDANATNSPQIVDVNLIIYRPILELSATQFYFTAAAGESNPAEQILTISNSGTGTLNWLITEDCNWLLAEPNSGSSTGEADDVNLIVDILGLGPGTYDCNILVSGTYAANSPQMADVNIVIYPWSGSGTAEDPYLIYTAAQMNYIGANPDDWDKHFKLTEDIDLGGFTGTSYNIIGTFWNNSFTGVFDGNGHTISNFTYESNGVDYIGLFGYALGNAEIKDLGLIDPNIDAGSGDYVGGLVGYLYQGSITGCYIDGGSVCGNRYIGGLVGRNYTGTISNCYSGGMVSGNDCIGGLVGYNVTNIFNCYSTGAVSGMTNVGGLVGQNYYATVLNSFWDIQTSGQSSSAGGKGKTTEELYTASTFIGWSGCGNEGVWTIDEGNDYPRLWWENLPGELLPAQNLSDFVAGTGEVNDPYLIETPEQLNIVGQFRCEWDKHLKLISSVDLSGFTGTSFNIIGSYWGNSFRGVFDGNGHTISKFTYDSNGVNYIGLFGYINGPNAEIRNLRVTEPNINAGTGSLVGSLVGEIEQGTITRCYVKGGTVSGYSSVGGLVGSNRQGEISDCYAQAEVFGVDREVGGLVGSQLAFGTISNCYANSNVLATRGAGGLLGTNQGRVSNCSANGTAEGEDSTGGLVGYNQRGIVSNCYATGDVSGNSGVGGLVGQDASSRISNCYANGAVDGNDRVGGLVGWGNGYYTKCFWDSDVNPDVNGIGFGSDPNVIGKTTAEMQTESTFTDAGWDFVGEVINGPNDFWDICEGTNYPKFVWQIPVADFICPDGVTMVDFSVLAYAWMSDPNDYNWDPNCDISEPNDNVIDESDVMVFTDNWLEGL